MKEHLFYLVDANLAIPLRNSFKIQEKFVEVTNFVPEMQPTTGSGAVLMHSNAIISKGETWMPEFDFLETDSMSCIKSPFSRADSFLRLKDEEEDDDEEEWDEDDEEWDDDDEDDDDEEEDWDEDDEEWDDDEDWDDEDADDEDEEWDEDGEAEE